MNFRESILFKFGTYFFIILFAEIVFASLVFFEFRQINNFVLNQNDEFDNISTNESTAYLKKLGMEIIKQRSLDIAKEIEIYLQFNPDKTIDDLRSNEEFRALAVQMFGGGYSAIHDETGWSLFHVDPKIEGTDLRLLDSQLPGFWKIIEKGETQEANGFYDWRDINGEIRKKYMYISPVSRKTADGKSIRVAFTANIDEFFSPVKELKEKIDSISSQSNEELMNFLNTIKIQTYFLLLSSFIAMLFLSLLFYRKMVVPIKELSRISKEISLGNFDSRLKVSSNDEISSLAENFNKMAVDLKESRENIEDKIKERTLQLEKINKYMVGRELKMAELKKEIDRIKKQTSD